MKKITTCIIALLFLFLSARSQQCATTNRYTEKAIFSKTQIKSDLNIVYGTAVNWQGQSQNLTLNIHYPKSTADTASKRPFIMMVHGGSFLTGQKEGLNKMCIEFARRGFVAATIDYRLGWNETSCSDTLTYYKAAYRAMQDANAALRYITAHAITYKIDTAWMFTGGESAGAGTVLAIAYTTQAEINAAYPPLRPLLGKLNTSGNTLTNTFTIKAIFNNWGGIYSQFYDNADALPMISFHGAVDGVVAIDSALDISCLTVKPMIYGSRVLHNKLTALGKCSDLTVKPNGGHGIYNNNIDQDIFRIGRACCFFKSLFCNSCVNYYATDSVAAHCSAAQRISIENTDPSFIIYPNPAGNEFFIDANNADDAGDLQLELYDVQGKCVLRKLIQGTQEINTSLLREGLYIAVLSGKEFLQRQKILIVR